MGDSSGSKVASLILRILTFVFLFISFFILVTNSKTIKGDYAEHKLHFNNFHAYRYMLATIIIGIIFNLLQIAFSLFNVIKDGNGNILFDFFGDKFLSYLLATGASAGFGLSVDLQTTDEGDYFKSFFDKAYASSSLLLFAFFCSAAVSIISSFALVKRV